MFLEILFFGTIVVSEKWRWAQELQIWDPWKKPCWKNAPQQDYRATKSIHGGDQNKTVFDLLTKFLLKEATAADMASTTLSNLFSTIYSTAKHTA